MIPASESILPTIQLVVTTAGTVAIAWIGVLQLRAKAKLAEATRKMDRATQRHEEVLTQIGTKLIDMETRIDKEKS